MGKKASESTCKAEQGVLMWRVNVNVESLSAQSWWRLSLSPTLETHISSTCPVPLINPLWAEVCLMHLWTPALWAFSSFWPYRTVRTHNWTRKTTLNMQVSAIVAASLIGDRYLIKAVRGLSIVFWKRCLHGYIYIAYIYIYVYTILALHTYMKTPPFKWGICWLWWGLHR